MRMNHKNRVRKNNLLLHQNRARKKKNLTEKMSPKSKFRIQKLNLTRKENKSRKKTSSPRIKAGSSRIKVSDRNRKIKVPGNPTSRKSSRKTASKTEKAGKLFPAIKRMSKKIPGTKKRDYKKYSVQKRREAGWFPFFNSDYFFSN